MAIASHFSPGRNHGILYRDQPRHVISVWRPNFEANKTAEHFCSALGFHLTETHHQLGVETVAGTGVGAGALTLTSRRKRAASSGGVGLM